jgi:hypothetical protein
MPNFFEAVDSIGVVEDHIKQILSLENDQAIQIMKSYQDIRKDLVDRLSKLPPGRFSAQHLRGVLAQVQGAITAIQDHLNGAMANGAFKAAMKGIEHLTSEIKTFDEEFTGAITPIDLNATLIARDTNNLLLTKYKTNLDAYGQGLFQKISNGLVNATIGAQNTGEIVGTLSQFFNGEEWKLTRIVRTELHHVYNLGKLNGLKEMSEEEEGLKKTLIHPMDARTGKDSEYAASLHLIADVSEPFEYSWDNKIRSYMVPPDRPNDRSVMVPYLPNWGHLQGDAFIPINSQAPRKPPRMK